MGPEIRPEVTARTRRVAVNAPHRQYRPEPRPATLSVRPAYVGEPETCRRNLRWFLAIWCQLALLVGIIKVYRVEGRALLVLGSICLAALPVHYALPFRWKRPFFLGTSLGGLVAVFGAWPALAVLGVTLPLIAVCRSPIRWSARVAIVATVAAGLAVARAVSVGSSWPVAEIVWPVAGSMLMFRMIFFLYESKHRTQPEPWLESLNYFFLLPNYAFLHFPVVDPKALTRGYFRRDIHETQVAGLRMMFKGLLHLLAYRLIYHRGLVAADDVSDPATLVAHVVGTYLLYLRVSGQFHVACGMLHLFGYSLPQTHNRYWLACGFTDYWRRVNIYWKDFMVRLVFNPVAFRLKRRPRWVALAAATSAVFLTTWLLHAYQSFWIRGTWGFSGPDALFWGILGVLVLVNVQLDARRSDRPASAQPDPNSTRAMILRSLGTAATFATLATLWTLWSSPSVSAFWNLLARAFRS